MPSGHRPQPPVGTARVAFSGLGAAGNSWVNVMWLNITATTHVLADFKAILSDLGGAYSTDLISSMSSAYSLEQVKGSWLYAAGNSIEAVVPAVHPGTASASYLTDSTCAVIDWSISDFYRGGHPRTYFPGIPAADIVNGRLLTSAYQTSLGTAANSFLTTVNSQSSGGISAIQLGTVRFASGNAWLSPPVFRAYQGANIRAVLGTQRRRYAAS
jgi:hypothetical protein